MNKLITNGFTGGFPYELDDIRWNDDAYRDAITNILIGITGIQNFIITGCENNLTSGQQASITIQAGYIMLDGELLKVDTHTTAYYAGGAVRNDHFIKQTTYNTAGVKISKDHEYTGSTYQQNRGIINGLVGNLAYNGIRLKDIVKNTSEISALNGRIDALTGSTGGLTWDDLASLVQDITNLRSKTNNMMEVLYMGTFKMTYTSGGDYSGGPTIETIYNPYSIEAGAVRDSIGHYSVNLGQTDQKFVTFCTGRVKTIGGNFTIAPKQSAIKGFTSLSAQTGETSTVYGFTVYASDDSSIDNDVDFDFTVFKHPTPPW